MFNRVVSLHSVGEKKKIADGDSDFVTKRGGNIDFTDFLFYAPEGAYLLISLLWVQYPA